MDYSNNEKTTPRLSVPQFGDWDQKGAMPDYSMDFSKIREMRKQNKRDPSRASLGNEQDFISSATSNSNTVQSDDQHHSPTIVEDCILVRLNEVHTLYHPARFPCDTLAFAHDGDTIWSIACITTRRIEMFAGWGNKFLANYRNLRRVFY